MLNRNIPVYEGNQPYIYACYSPEDEMLVLPVLTRMYNEGFRFWSANLVEKLSDFIAVRHVSTSACVVIFMSHNMLERINSGVPEVLAACRSSLLRAVVLLDEVRPDNRIFALTAPERMEYQRSNDAGFWLNVYSADYLERCRGPWPEVKLSLQEPTYEDVRQDAIAAEYISLENIITRGGTKPETIAAAQPYPNNKGYVQPQPDEFTYEPLGKVEAVRTVHDKDYDDALALLNQCADRQIDIIINHTRPGQNTVPSLPTLSPIKPMPDKQAELDAIKEELARSAQPTERPERRIDPEVRTKADMIVEPEDKPEEAPAAEEIPYIPEPEITAESIAESIRQLTMNGTYAAPEQSEQPEPVAEEIAQESSADDVAEDRSESVTERNTAAESAKTTVQVVVRKPQPTVRVTPVRKRVITEPARTAAPRANAAPKLSRSSVGGHLRGIESDPVAFEQYIRNIALDAVSAAEKSVEEAAPVSRRRFGRVNRAPETPVEASVQIPVTAAAPKAAEAPLPSAPEKVETVSETAAEEAAAGEKTSRRKSRFPHNSEVLTGLIAALRRERTAVREEVEPSETESSPEVREIMANIRAAATEQNDDAARSAESGVKVIRLSDAISERKVSDLQEAVNKFMSLDNAPEAVPLTARVCLRRR